MGMSGRTPDAGEVAPESLPLTLRPALERLRKERLRLMEIQWSHGVNEPMPMALDIMVLTLNWASGCSWESMSDSAQERGLADGDLFRSLRRALEFLQGMATVTDGLDLDAAEVESWRKRTMEASSLLDRSPLSDNLALEDGEEIDLGF